MTTSDGTSGGSPVSQTAAITVAETTALSETVSPISGQRERVGHAEQLCGGVGYAEHRRCVADDDADGYARHDHVRETLGSGTGTVTLTGTAAQIDTALANASYTGGLNYYGSDSLQVTTSDAAPAGGSTGEPDGGDHGHRYDDANVGNGDGARRSLVNENTAIPLSNYDRWKSDSPNTGDTLTTVLTVTHGTIAIATWARIVSGNSSTVTLTGTAAAIDSGAGERELYRRRQLLRQRQPARWPRPMRTAPAAASPVTKTAAITVHQQRQCGGGDGAGDAHWSTRTRRSR